MSKLRSLSFILVFGLICMMIWTQLQSGAAVGPRSDKIFDMLGAVPAASFEDGFTLEYGNVQAAISFVENADVAALYGFANAGPREIAELGLQQRARMKPLVGFEHADIDHILHLSQDGRTAQVIDLMPGNAANVMLSLERSGYSAETRNGTRIMARGADLAFDRSIADSADFFSRAIGIASRVTVQGDRILQARDWGTMDAMVAPSRISPQSDEDLAAVLRSLDAPFDVLNGATLVKVTALSGMADRSIGFDTVSIAHFATAQSDIAVLAIPAASNSSAQDLASTVAQNWADNVEIEDGVSLFDIVYTTSAPVVDVVSAKRAVVRIALTTPRDGGLGVQGNTSLNTLFMLVIRGHLPALTGQQ